jgi:hypothetical protein
MDRTIDEPEGAHSGITHPLAGGHGRGKTNGSTRRGSISPVGEPGVGQDRGVEVAQPSEPFQHAYHSQYRARDKGRTQATKKKPTGRDYVT